MKQELRTKKRGWIDQGFTLIETLIYSALTTLIAAFAIIIAYQLIDSSDRLRSQREMAENKKFLEQKIYWALQNISTINSPTSGATSTSLSVTKLNYASNPVVIDGSQSVVKIQKGGGVAVPITNEYVAAQDLNFHQFDFSGRPAIRVSGNLFNNFTSTTVDINFTILTK